MDSHQDKLENYVETTENNENELGIDSIKILKDFNAMFWLISIICVTLYCAVLPFNYIASGFLTNTIFANIKDKQIAQEKAGLFMSIPFFISAFTVPVFGIIIDKFGQRAYFILLSSLVGLLAFSMFYFISPIYCLVLIGLTYSLFASVIWPAISLVVKKSQVVNINKKIYSNLLTLYKNCRDLLMVFLLLFKIQD